MSTQDTPLTDAKLTAILDRDNCLGPRNAPQEWVYFARDLERVANRLADALRKAKAAMLYHSGWTRNFDETGKELPMTRPTKVAEADSESTAALRDFEELKK